MNIPLAAAPRLRIPHRFTLHGRNWRVRYGDPSGEALSTSTEWGACVYSERTIYLHPTLRLRANRARLLDTFIHELLHAIDESTRKRAAWRRLSHRTINEVARELGEWLAANEGGG